MDENIVIDSSLRTVEWKNNKVIMIEQTKLPNELIFVEYDDFNQVANAIKTLIVRGAPAIGVSGAFGLGLAVLQSKATTKNDLLSDLECDSILSKEVWSSKGLLVTTKNAFNESFYKKEIALIIPKNKRAVSNILDKITKKRKSMDKIRENGYRYSLNKLNILKNTKKLTISY